MGAGVAAGRGVDAGVETGAAVTAAAEPAWAQREASRTDQMPQQKLAPRKLTLRRPAGTGIQ